MVSKKEILARAKEIPPLSPATFKLMEIMGREDYDMQEIVKIVEADPVLTLKVLKVVNSASFGLRSQIQSVSRAVSFLGEKMIVGVAVGAGAPHMFDRELKGYEGGQKELWAHGLKTAIAAMLLAPRSKKPVPPDQAFTAGVLHDIGKSVLSEFLEGTAENFIEQLNNGEVESYLEAESAVLGVDHCMVGRELAKQWELPPSLSAAITHHHHPLKAKEEFRPLVFVVHLGDVMAMITGSGTGSDSMLYTMDDKLSEYLHLTGNEMEEILLEVLFEFDKYSESLFGAGGGA